MLDQNTIDRIHDAAQIQEVVSDYVTLRRRGVNLIGLCPFHNEKTPSFIVSPAKGIFKCFGCGKGGNSVNFIMEHEQIGYLDALKYLANKYHIEFQERELSDEEKAVRNDRESMFLVNDFAQKHFTTNLLHHIDGKSIGLAYFRERGFRDDIIDKFQLGYSLDQRDYLSQSALKSGYNKEFLVKTGLTIENEQGYLSDRFRGRVIFPVHSLSGKVIAFGGRILKKDDKMAKYVNSPESDIYHKSNELYGIFFAKKSIVKQDRCFLVEGYTDVISMHQSGIENVVASSGTSLTPGQIRLIHRFTENVTVIYDGDAAGIKASLRGIDLLLEEGLNIQVLLLPDGEDPDSFARKHNASDFIEFVEKNSSDFIRFKTRLLMSDAGNDPVKRAGLITDIVRSISIIPNNVVRSEYVKECSNLLNVQEAMLYHEINKIKGNELAKQQNQDANRKIEPEIAAKGSEPSQFVQSLTAFEQEERNLLQVLIKFGKKILYIDNELNMKKILVADFIFDEFEKDNIILRNSLHENILTQYQKNYLSESFDGERFFVMHPDQAIAKLAADLVTEKYSLSKIHAKVKKVEDDQDRLFDLIPRLVYEYKNCILQDKMKQLLMQIKHASEEKNYELASSLMKNFKVLEQSKHDIARILGERIINRM